MSNYSAFHIRDCTLSFAFELLTIGAKNTKDNALSFIHVMEFRVRGQQRPPHDFPKRDFTHVGLRCTSEVLGVDRITTPV